MMSFNTNQALWLQEQRQRRIKQWQGLANDYGQEPDSLYWSVDTDEPEAVEEVIENMSVEEVAALIIRFANVLKQSRLE